MFERRVEHEGFPFEVRSARRCHHSAERLGRSRLPVAAEKTRQQRHGLSAARPKAEQRTAVANPPLVLGPQPDSPAAHGRKVQCIPQAERPRPALRGCEYDPFVPSDHGEGGIQFGSGCASTAFVEQAGQVVHRALRIGPAVNRSLPLQVGAIGQRQEAAAQQGSESELVEAAHARAEDAVVGKLPGRTAGDPRRLEQADPNVRRQWNYGDVGGSDIVRRNKTQVQPPTAGRRFGQPDHAPSGRKDTLRRRDGFARLDEKIRRRLRLDQPRQGRSDPLDPKIDLSCRLRTVESLQDIALDPTQDGVLKPFDHEDEIVLAFAGARRDTRQEPARVGMQQVARRLHLLPVPPRDEGNIDGAALDVPDRAGIVQRQGQVRRRPHDNAPPRHDGSQACRLFHR